MPQGPGGVIFMSLPPAEPRAVAFIDGQNLFRHAKDAFGHHHPNFDPGKPLQAICVRQGWKPQGVRFYTGTPSEVEDPKWHAYWTNRLLAMRRAGILVTSRPLKYRKQEIPLPDGSTQIVTTAHEKGIDVRLALDVVRLAIEKQYDVAVLFSQDQDLAEVITDVRQIAKLQERWIKIACAFPLGSEATASRGINNTDWLPMDKAFYDACLDMRDYRPKNIRA
jgi:uncharacterized LabA/DUF88 family protein